MFKYFTKINEHLRKFSNMFIQIKDELKQHKIELKQLERINSLEKDINTLKYQNINLINRINILEQTLFSTYDKDIIKSYISSIKKQYE